MTRRVTGTRGQVHRPAAHLGHLELSRATTARSDGSRTTAPRSAVPWNTPSRNWSGHQGMTTVLFFAARGPGSETRAGHADKDICTGRRSVPLSSPRASPDCTPGEARRTPFLLGRRRSLHAATGCPTAKRAYGIFDKSAIRPPSTPPQPLSGLASGRVGLKRKHLENWSPLPYPPSRQTLGSSVRAVSGEGRRLLTDPGIVLLPAFTCEAPPYDQIKPGTLRGRFCSAAWSSDDVIALSVHPREAGSMH
jgi:hypothetical protein